jgi:hypothetical protein
VPTRRPFLGLLGVVLSAGSIGCTNPSPPPSASGLSTVTAGASASESAAADLIPEPGRPFDAQAILVAMRESRRPGGVPAELQTDEIAAAVADRVWTFDGEPWRDLVIGGSCGPETCTLEVAGRTEGALGEDLYVFSVTPSTEIVDLVSADLLGVPEDLLDDLDATARAGVEEPLEGLSLLGVRWLPPPAAGQYVLAYRPGGEEGSCGMDVVLDAAVGAITSANEVNC